MATWNMATKAQGGQLVSPWKEFLGEIDAMLQTPLDLYCIGGFVFSQFYGLPRNTADID